jgi:large subunit ribosomal protein L13
MIIDATNLIVGRLGTVVAKQALLGEKIDIINSDKAAVSGTREVVLGKFKERVERRKWSKGPHYTRDSDMLLKRMIRNMLPYKQTRGEEAFERIKCWMGVPAEFKGKEVTKLDIADVSKLNIDYVTISEISRFLGGKFE